ncbi:VOC family protein [Anaerophaga thermohalophila]|jgi:catechol 2,3-dioxygenase-like lactoylglutathione lyase family enzyme|uniref:VOC family protein n=1 Tax=Anaerophaga thermohalophila TaxID=177400 RepID=UPI0002ECC8A3|nr:VOC family protein [Anaerophaga thermohalophila]
MQKNICGIQQIGIGLKDAKEAWRWYRKNFGMDINVFEDTATAKLMHHYTNGKDCERYAALAMNMEGGGGFEVWQHTRMEPKPPAFDVQLGDTGIFITRMKCRDVTAAYKQHKLMGVNLIGEPVKNPAGQLHYYLADPYSNIFEVVEDHHYFMKQKSPTGGVAGAVIGVSDIDRAREVYSGILQYDEVIFDKTDVFDDFNPLPGGKQKYRRVLLGHKKRRTGPFSKLLGPTQIELVQSLERTPKQIFENRIWGELGFIHICFDITGMEALQKECEAKGFPFTVNSADSFDMGSAAGHFSYISDPDGTPIEFVETHKLPVVEKLGLYINLKKRNPQKPLPDWMVKTLTFGRVKD